MSTQTAAVTPEPANKSWSNLLPSWVPLIGSQPVRLEEAPIPAKKGIWQRFNEFSDMQQKFIAEQPLVAAVYMIAAIFFGLPHLLSFNPFSFLYGALTVYFGFALAWNMWNNEGVMKFISRVVAEFKAYTAKTDAPADKKKPEAASSINC